MAQGQWGRLLSRWKMSKELFMEKPLQFLSIPVIAAVSGFPAVQVSSPLHHFTSNSPLQYILFFASLVYVILSDLTPIITYQLKSACKFYIRLFDLNFEVADAFSCCIWNIL